jgi:DNA primase large subunit
MEEALLFWRTEFAPRTPSDKFDKEYAYNIRHNYGREGKRTDYTAHKCVGPPGAVRGPAPVQSPPQQQQSSPDKQQRDMMRGP